MRTVGSQRPGGRTQRTRAQVHDAALRLLASRGVGFGMEELAREAGVHKTTLYRRWPTVADLLGQLTAEVIGQDVPIPDSGTLRADLRAFAGSIASVIGHPIRGPAMVALFTAPPEFGEVAAVIDHFWTVRLPALQPITDRAIERSEIPAGTQTALMFESLGAPLYYRLFLTRQPIDDAAVDRAVNVALHAARAGLFAPDTARRAPITTEP